MMASGSLAPVGMKLPELKRSATQPVQPKRNNHSSQHLRRMAYWNKLKQDNLDRQAKKSNSKGRNRRRNSENDIIYQEPYFSKNRSVHRWEDFRNAAHPRKAKFITTIQGAFLPTIFDENLASRRVTTDVQSGPGSEICLNDILMFDQDKHNQDLDRRNNILGKIRSSNPSPMPAILPGTSHSVMSEPNVTKETPGVSQSVSVPSSASLGQKVTFDPKPLFERQTLPTWRKSLSNMIDELGVKMELNLEAKEDCTDPNDVTAMVRQTTRSGTASTVCNSLVESGIGLSTADSSRPVSVLEVLSKCEDSVKLAQMRKKSRGSRSGSVRTLGSARPKSSATITEESIRELDAESSKGDESAIIKRITKTVNNLEFTEDMLMYLLCQIFQTTHEKVVHEWLESASASDKEYVIGLLKTALAN